MKTSEHAKLVAEYGVEKAQKAVAWFVANHSADFRKSVKQADFCRHNEYLWF